jgi:glycosyltransferase involved in cell wall biosynthesis
MKPFISVVIPTYNREHVLPRAYASVAAERGEDMEIIIVDDASTDGTRHWIESQDDSRLRALYLEKNVGVNAARNRGVEAAEGTWIVLLDSDDELVPGAMHSIRKTIQATEAGWLLGRCVTTDGASTVRNPGKTGYISYRDYLRGAIAGEYLPVTKRAVLLEHPFSEKIRGGEHLTWLAIAKAGYGPYVANAVWRAYDTSGTDRLTIKSSNHKRLAKVFRHDIKTQWQEYLRHHPKRLVGTIARAVWYTGASILKP